MRVEIYSASNAEELAHDLNAVLENYDDGEIEIQYQHCATKTGCSWSEFFSAMVIFKGRGAA